MTRTLTAVKLTPKSHKGKNVVASVSSSAAAWDGWWRVTSRDNPLQPGKLLLTPALPDGRTLPHFARWVAFSNPDPNFSLNLTEGVWEPAGAIDDPGGSPGQP